MAEKPTKEEHDQLPVEKVDTQVQEVMQHLKNIEEEEQEEDPVLEEFTKNHPDQDTEGVDKVDNITEEERGNYGI